MKFYAVLLLVAAVSAEADYLHVVPQTHTVLTKQVPTIFKQIQHVPTLYQTVQKPLEDVHTPIVYQTLQTPTIFKIDEDKLVKVDHDDEDEDEDKEGEVLPLIKHITHKRIVRSADNEDYYISNADNTQFYKVKLDDVDEDE